MCLKAVFFWCKTPFPKKIASLSVKGGGVPLLSVKLRKFRKLFQKFSSIKVGGGGGIHPKFLNMWLLGNIPAQYLRDHFQYHLFTRKHLGAISWGTQSSNASLETGRGSPACQGTGWSSSSRASLPWWSFTINRSAQWRQCGWSDLLVPLLLVPGRSSLSSSSWWGRVSYYIPVFQEQDE